jgi:hypothetical protein
MNIYHDVDDASMSPFRVASVITTPGSYPEVVVSRDDAAVDERLPALVGHAEE